MPLEYEHVRDALIARGKSTKEAKHIAAAKWNKDHPENPNPWRNERRRANAEKAVRQKKNEPS